ncbi:MAG: carbohydrate-binding domain-containing protein [Lachnospiraceae bacterium]|nr:carbohydrate-binding domain-containing protein [Lachnospiraceae bacterium]
MKRSLKILFCLSLLAFVFGIGNISAKAEEKYDVWIGGTQVTSSNKNSIPGKNGGYAAYDPDTSTLTFYNFKDVKVPSEASLQMGFEENLYGFLVYAGGDLTIKGTASFSDEPHDYMVGIISYGILTVDGKFDIKTMDHALHGHDGLVITGKDTVVNAVTDSYGSACIFSKGDVEIENGKITCSADIDEAAGIRGADVLIYGGDININVENGQCIKVGAYGDVIISGGKLYAYSSDGIYAYNVEITGGSIEIDCTTDDCTAIFAKNSLNIADDLGIIEPVNGDIYSYEDGTYTVYDFNMERSASYVKIGEAYDVWIGGVRVTGENKNRINGKNGGYAKYDPESYTLAFYNFKDVVKNIYSEYAGYLVYTQESLTIKGTASFGETPISENGITSYGILTVSGKFDIKVEDEAFHGHDGLVITGKDTVVNVTTELFPSTCIYAKGPTEIKDAKVTCYSMMDEALGIRGSSVDISGADITIKCTGNPSDGIKSGTYGEINITNNSKIDIECTGNGIDTNEINIINSEVKVKGAALPIEGREKFTIDPELLILNPLGGKVVKLYEVYQIVDEEGDAPSDVWIGKNPITITMNPSDTAVEEGQLAYFEVSATGNNLKYLWQYKEKGQTTWTDWEAKKTAKISVAYAKNRNGMSLRCIITDASGITATSGEAVLTYTAAGTSSFSITDQPKDASVPENELAYFGIKAKGEGLTYLWQYKNKGETTWTDWTSKKTANISVAYSKSRNGMSLRCKVTNNAGKELISNVATLTYTSASGPSITEQPKNTSVKAGELAYFGVTAKGDGLTYLWQYKNTGSSTWTDWTSKKAASISVAYQASRNGMSLRCVVTDKNGNKVTSSAAVLTYTSASGPSITEQPKNASVAENELAYFSVKATGSGLTYLWQYKNKGESTWTDWTSKKAASISVAYLASRNGMSLRCVVTDKNGNKVTSNAATLTYTTALKITTQPVNSTVNKNELAYFTVKAEGKGLTYLWQYKLAGDSTWTDWTSKKAASISVAYAAYRNNMQLRCVVTDSNGNTVTSNVVTLKYNP